MSDATDSAGGRRRLPLWVSALRIAGFVAGLAVLVWCVVLVASPQNREQISRLGDAGAGPFAALLGLSLLSIAINGMIFWITILPVKRLGVPRVLAVHSVAVLMAYLPLKLSVVFRVVAHNRLDKLPVLTIGSWFAASGLLMFASPAPLILMSLIHPALDWVWLGGSAAGLALLVLAVVPLAKFFAHEVGLRRLRRLAMWTRVPWVVALAHTSHAERLQAGFAMLSRWREVSVCVALRLGDVVAQGARFLIAAQVLGVPLDWQDSLLLALAFFFTGVVTPVGSLGTREGVTVGLALLLGAGAGENAAVVIVLVSAADAVANLVAGVFGILVLGPHRLIVLRRERKKVMAEVEAAASAKEDERRA